MFQIIFSRIENRWWKRISRVVLLILVLLCEAPPLVARDIHVDPRQGNDASAKGPVKTIKQAIRVAEPGDTIHLLPIIYHEYAGFYGKSGAPGKPITLDGHGATLEGSDPLDPRQWVDKGEGLFECNQLLPHLDDAIIQRWFFLWNGKMVHMGRTSKGPSEPLKHPEALQPGEWTFVKNTDINKNTDIKMPKPSQISGTFYLKLPPGQKLSEQNIRVPTRSAGVQFSNAGTRHNAHLVIRNLTATHPYNDGFNIHGHCEDVLFENIRAIECGDDGISAHETAQYRVDGFVSIGNSTGICDTGASETSYNRVLIRDCLGFDLYFLDTGRYSLSNTIVFSSAAKTLYLTGRTPPERSCSLKLENVFIRRMTGKNEVRISTNCLFDARRVTFMGLNFQATGGDVQLNESIIASAPVLPDYPAACDYLAASKQSHETLVPEMLLWRDVKWTADHNQYELKSLRLDKTFYTADHFDQFQKQTGQDIHSRWVTHISNDPTRGANLEQLKELLIPESKTKNDTLNSLLPKWE